jgi:hypothetical protein
MHDFECTCGNRQEELLDVPPGLASIQCRKCGALMEHVLMGGKAYVFRPFDHPHLDHTPVHIGSWRQYKEELQKRNLASPLGS